MSKKINIKDRQVTIERHVQRQMSWCRRRFPEGTLVSYISFKIDYVPSKINNVGLVVGYGWKDLSSTLYLRVLTDAGVSLIAPNSAKSIQKPFRKIVEKSDTARYLSCSGD